MTQGSDSTSAFATEGVVASIGTGEEAETLILVSGITSASAEASFSGTGTVLSAQPSYTATAATMTQPTFSAEFTGTSKSVTPAVATTVQAAGTDGAVTVTSETITPSATSTEKTVSVTFA